MISTVIFDMDGTITDTEKVYEAAWLKAGVRKDDYLKIIGRSSVSIHGILEESGYDADRVIADMRRYTKESIEKGIELKPGAREALSRIKEKHLTTVIATSSPLERAHRYMEQTGLTDLIDLYVSGNQLEHGKPAPDIFLLAAQKAGADPSSCVVVEDSFNGVRAGKAAGMVTVMVPDLVPADEEMRHTADIILTSLFDLPAFLDGLEAGKEKG